MLRRVGSPAERVIDAFRQGLRELGYVEGQNVVIEYRCGGGPARAAPGLAAELVRLKVDVIVTRREAAAWPPRRRPPRFPSSSAVGGDPVRRGLVASLARPGGNITGREHHLHASWSAKRLELLKEVLPEAHADRGPREPGLPRRPASARKSAGARPRVAGRPAFSVVDVPSPERIRTRASRTWPAERAEALLVASDRRSSCSGRDASSELAREAPAAGDLSAREFVDAGGLMTYGADVPDIVSPCRDLRRQDPQGREARRPARRAADEVRAGDQSQDREGARPDDPAVGAGAGGRGDSVDGPAGTSSLAPSASSPRRSPPRRSTREGSRGRHLDGSTCATRTYARRSGDGSAGARLRRGPEPRHRVSLGGRRRSSRCPASPPSWSDSRSMSSWRQEPAARWPPKATTRSPSSWRRVE